MPVSAASTVPPLSPLVGLRIAVLSSSLERAQDRARGLELLGYNAYASAELAAVAAFIAEITPGAVVIEATRDGAPADDLCTRVRAATDVPLAVIGASGSLNEMMRCLDAGADEYCRPQALADEVDLRLRAIFRRMRMATPLAEAAPQESVLHIGELEIDLASQVVRKRGQLIALSPTEFRLLATLAEHAGRVIPSRALLSRVWGNQYADEAHYLRLYVRYLRRKLEDDPARPEYIVNRWGSGYALEVPPRAA